MFSSSRRCSLPRLGLILRGSSASWEEMRIESKSCGRWTPRFRDVGTKHAECQDHQEVKRQGQSSGSYSAMVVAVMVERKKESGLLRARTSTPVLLVTTDKEWGKYYVA